MTGTLLHVQISEYFTKDIWVFTFVIFTYIYR
jgi:hypothetical protein